MDPLATQPRPAPHRVALAVTAREAARVAEILRQETVGGFLLVAAAVVAMVLANSPLSNAYLGLRDLRVGPEAWQLDLTLGQWASDGLLAIFFFVVGLELKREAVAGSLRHVRTAIVPVAAAVGGVVVPALIFAAVNLGDAAALRGWAIPTATDIAFAVAVLAVLGSGLPMAARLFLLTLAVVDDLIAIGIIAVVYTEAVDVVPLAAALAPLGLFALLVQARPRWFEAQPLAAWVLLLPVGFVAWALVHASGIHATVAGVLLAFTVPVRYSERDVGERHIHQAGGLAEVLEHRIRPISAGFAAPIFAFFAAGVVLGGIDGVATALADPIAVGVVLGLVVGKPVGILATTWLLTRATGAALDPTLAWRDLVGTSVLAGIGFTVALLVAELSFGVDTPHGEAAKVAILVASVLASVAAGIVLRIGRQRRR